MNKWVMCLAYSEIEKAQRRSSLKFREKQVWKTLQCLKLSDMIHEFAWQPLSKRRQKAQI